MSSTMRSPCARCCCAATLDARFVLYHHVVRRRVTVALGGEFDDPFCAAHIDTQLARAAGGRRAVRQRAVPDLVRRPARGKAGWPERLQRRLRPRRRRRSRPIPPTLRALRAAATRRCSPRSAPTARGCSATTTAPSGRPARSCSNSSRRSTMARCARSCCPSDGTDLGQHAALPARQLRPRRDGAARRRRPQLRRACSRSRTIPTRRARA